MFSTVTCANVPGMNDIDPTVLELAKKDFVG